MNLNELKDEMMMEEAIASAELAGVNKYTPQAQVILEGIEEFNEKFGDTDTYPNDLIPKNDVMATREHIRKFLRQFALDIVKAGSGVEEKTDIRLKEDASDSGRFDVAYEQGEDSGFNYALSQIKAEKDLTIKQIDI